VILPFVVFVWCFAESVIVIFAGKDYADAADLLRLTALFGLFMPYAVQFGTALDATGKPDVNLAYTFFTAVLNLVLSYYFVQNWGLYGAVYATLTGYMISFVLMQHYLYKHFGVNALRALPYIPAFYQTGWRLLKRRFISG
jgi:O-antigen/teichoic acid export membrane protein